jgi:hypothetical protein
MGYMKKKSTILKTIIAIWTMIMILKHLPLALIVDIVVLLVICLLVYLFFWWGSEDK